MHDPVSGQSNMNTAPIAVCICGRRFDEGRPEKCDACSRRERSRQDAYEDSYEDAAEEPKP